MNRSFADIAVEDARRETIKKWVIAAYIVAVGAGITNNVRTQTRYADEQAAEKTAAEIAATIREDQESMQRLDSYLTGKNPHAYDLPAAALK